MMVEDKGTVAVAVKKARSSSKRKIEQVEQVELEAADMISSVEDNGYYQKGAEAAYFIAEKRGFVGGDPVADWLTAEAELNQQKAAQRNKN